MRLAYTSTFRPTSPVLSRSSTTPTRTTPSRWGNTAFGSPDRFPFSSRVSFPFRLSFVISIFYPSSLVSPPGTRPLSTGACGPFACSSRCI
ncbi:hypothetical protein RSAG8_02510, partial [Rhizoctonia solani AG-8 WAC10335]